MFLSKLGHCWMVMKHFCRHFGSTSLRNGHGFHRHIESFNQKITEQIRFCSTGTTWKLDNIQYSDGIQHSPFPSVLIPKHTSFAAYALTEFEKEKNLLALINGETGQSYTFGDLIDAVFKVASGLRKAGYKNGDTVCILAKNSPEYCIFLLAALAVGITVTLANPSCTVYELAHHLNDSGSKAVITQPDQVPTLKEAIGNTPQIKSVVFLSKDDRLSEWDLCGSTSQHLIVWLDPSLTHIIDLPDGAIQEIMVFGTADGCRPYSSLMEDHNYLSEIYDNNSVDDTMLLPYSSGTTGLPKGVMLTNYNILSNLMQFKDLMPDMHGHSRIGLLPFYHIYGFIIVLFSSLLKKEHVITMAKFNPELFLDMVQKYKVSLVHTVPPIVLFLVKDSIVSKYDLSSIQYVVSGAAPLSNQLIQELQEKLRKDASIVQGYGLTECSPVTHFDVPPSRIGSVGQLVPNTQAKIINLETGQNLGSNQMGEICVKGPQVMKGYLNRPEATAEAIRDGWFHTGDIGHYDQDGYFYITDRLKELIKFKGLQVAPAELEAVLLSHPVVQDAAVIGIPDANAGEVPYAFVVLKNDVQVKKEEISAFVETKVAPHKFLRGGLEVVDEIPKSPSGKILRKQLKKRFSK